MVHSNSFDARRDPSHPHGHHHEPSLPHPAQPLPWSILRMTVLSRLAAALALSAGLWAVVLAMR